MSMTGDAIDGVRPMVRERAGRLPNFLIIGAMKSGTTSLFHYLGAHPDAYLSPLKEVEFFVDGGNWRRGLDWYRAQFADASSDAVAIGEASTAYTKFPEYGDVPDRISSVIPDARLIYLVRDPVERIRSHYQHRVLAGAERAPMRTAVLEDPRYVDCSRYAMQLERYLAHFRAEQILLVTSEDLRARRSATVRAVYRFLGLDEDVESDVFAQEFYRSQDRTRYPPLAWWARRMVKRYVPAGKRMKELVDRARPGTQLGGSNAEARTETQAFVVPSDVRERLIELLRDDVTRLRTYMPQSFDGWGIA